MLTIDKTRRAETAQMALDWTNRMSDTTHAPKIARRRASKAKTSNQEYIDIGPYRGSRPVVDLPATTRKCQCARCGLAFTSPSSFDDHQRIVNGALVCLSPETVGLVVNDGWWSYPPDPRFAKDDSES